MKSIYLGMPFIRASLCESKLNGFCRMYGLPTCFTEEALRNWPVEFCLNQWLYAVGKDKETIARRLIT